MPFLVGMTTRAERETLREFGWTVERMSLRRWTRIRGRYGYPPKPDVPEDADVQFVSIWAGGDLPTLVYDDDRRPYRGTGRSWAIGVEDPLRAETSWPVLQPAEWHGLFNDPPYVGDDPIDDDEGDLRYYLIPVSASVTEVLSHLAWEENSRRDQEVW